MWKKYIKIKEASELLGVSQLTLRNWDKKKKLVAYRHPINNYRLYKMADLEKLLKRTERNRPRKIAVRFEE